MVFFLVHSNGFIGSLPPSLGNWTDLSWLEVQSNQLSGSLSDSFGAWSQLSTFNLNGNRFTGSLPENIGDWGMLHIFQVRRCVDGCCSTLENCSHTSFCCIILHRLIVTYSQGICQIRWLDGLTSKIFWWMTMTSQALCRMGWRRGLMLLSLVWEIQT